MGSTPSQLDTTLSHEEPITKRTYDLEGKTIGIYGAGAIGQLVAMRLKPFDVMMYYYKRSHLSNTEEAVCGFRYVRLDDMLAHCASSRTPSPPRRITRGGR
jgi:lactate dehydrogenase-like 2-hydroxyacid dehydrogenase